jgi:predicted acylesterase/phospholipase RssA
MMALCEGKCPATSGVPLDAGVFTGTSVGNFNAAILAMNIDGALASAKRLRDIWTNDIADNADGCGNGVYRIRGGLDGYLDPRSPGTPVEQLRRVFGDAGVLGKFAMRSAGKLFAGHGQLLTRLSHMVDITPFMDVSPFDDLIRTRVYPRVLCASPRRLTVTATNWTTGTARTFDFCSSTDEQTWDAIRASAAIPGLFPPVTIDGHLFIDGGVVMNTPIKPAIDSNASELHVVSLNPSVPDLSAAYEGDTLDVLGHVFASMVASNIDEDVESARWINEGIEIVENAGHSQHADSADGKRFTRAAAKIARKLKADGTLLRKLTIHRYFPTKPLGSIRGLLNFQRSVIDSMIAQGYGDAVKHDCKASGCLIPAAQV